MVRVRGQFDLISDNEPLTYEKVLVLSTLPVEFISLLVPILVSSPTIFI